MTTLIILLKGFAVLISCLIFSVCVGYTITKIIQKREKRYARRSKTKN